GGKGLLLQDNGIDETKLIDLARDFFQEMDLDIQEDITLIGSSGKRYSFEMLIKSETNVDINELLVYIVDWKRAVGVDRLIRFERILNDLDKRKGIIVSNSFSDSAVNFAKRRGLIIYSRDHLHLFAE
ncbi:MAG: restriction endonuclease, partial [Candidatus Heimdallarchaeota archaeon]